MSWMRWETFGADYLLLAFMVSVGVLQLVVAWRRLDGLSLFLRRRYLAYALSVLLIAAAYWLFFRHPRNIPDYAGGLAGAQLFIYTIAGIVAAVLATLIVSSALNARWSTPDPAGVEKGINALKRMTYFQALRRSFQKRGVDDLA
ncbi:MAG: hypothetical protein SVP26_03465 [Chloroflexota bacterium]|nr:hypothetical protein [Chloroflexota bacterium]